MIGAIIAIGIDINDHFLIILAMVVIVVLVNVPMCVHIILRGYLSSLYDALLELNNRLKTEITVDEIFHKWKGPNVEAANMDLGGATMPWLCQRES